MNIKEIAGAVAHVLVLAVRIALMFDFMVRFAVAVLLHQWSDALWYMLVVVALNPLWYNRT